MLNTGLYHKLNHISLFSCLFVVNNSNCAFLPSENGVRHLPSLSGRTHLLHLLELLHRPSHPKSWPQLLWGLPPPALGRHQSSCPLPYMLGTIAAEGLQNKHCSEEAGVHCQTIQPQEVPKLQGTQVCDPQGDLEDLLRGEQDLPL